MKRLSILLIALLCVGMLSGCAVAQVLSQMQEDEAQSELSSALADRLKEVQPSAPPEPPTSSSGASASSSEPPASSSQAQPEDVIISIDYATDEVLSGYAYYEEFDEFDGGDYPRIIISTNVPLRDFTYIDVGFREEGADIVLYENAMLDWLYQLTPERPFVATWMERGSIPHRGISYTDEYGSIKYFTISMSGEDGSLLLSEFEPGGGEQSVDEAITLEEPAYFILTDSEINDDAIRDYGFAELYLYLAPDGTGLWASGGQTEFISWNHRMINDMAYEWDGNGIRLYLPSGSVEYYARESNIPQRVLDEYAFMLEYVESIAVG